MIFNRQQTSVLKAQPRQRISNLYEGHLKSSKHGIITPQCVDKMLSNSTFLETRIQWLHDGLIFVEKGLGMHVQRML